MVELRFCCFFCCLVWVCVVWVLRLAVSGLGGLLFALRLWVYLSFIDFRRRLRVGFVLVVICCLLGFAIWVLIACLILLT